jgi:hypothetical protein
MNSTRCFLKLSPLFAATLLAACASAPPAKSKAVPSLALNQPVHVEGVLTDNGMGCAALRTRDGSLYTFARELEGPKKGERIWIDGYVTATKGCRLGTNIMPERAGLINERVADSGTGAVAGNL